MLAKDREKLKIAVETNHLRQTINSPYSAWKQGYKIQSILVPFIYNYYDTREWLDEHGYKTSKTNVSNTHHHFKQQEYDPKKTYISKKLKNEIIFIYYV